MIVTTSPGLTQVTSFPPRGSFVKNRGVNEHPYCTHKFNINVIPIIRNCIKGWNKCRKIIKFKRICQWNKYKHIVKLVLNWHIIQWNCRGPDMHIKLFHSFNIESKFTIAIYRTCLIHVIAIQLVHMCYQCLNYLLFDYF